MTANDGVSVRSRSDERDLFQQILEQMPEGVITLDEQQRVTYANPAALALLGLSESPVSRTLLESIRTPDLHALVCQTTPTEPQAREFRPSARQDAPWLLGRAAVQPGRETIVLVLHDVSELHRLETIRQDFVANVSHELRTPVSVVLANAETLLAGALDDREAAEQFLEALRRNARRLSHVVSDLLEISRLDAGKYPLEVGDVVLWTVVDQVVATAASQIASKGLTVQIDVPKDAQVRADGKALVQVLGNLIDNAIKYTPADGRIVVRARKQGGIELIEVSDNGPGIDAQHRERVFERFFRVDAGRSRAMGGTGLGLAIVKNLVESMKGTVAVDQADGGGARFVIELPAAAVAPACQAEQARAEATGPAASSLRWPQQPAPEPPSPPFSWHVLDANPRLRQLRQRLLLMGGRIEEMVTKAVEALVNGDPDLARETVRSDARTNRDEVEIDQMCLDLLSAAHAEAGERRFIMLVLKVVVDLERIGDIAVNICERAVELATNKPSRPLSDIQRMADRVHAMIRDAIDAFVAHDSAKARSVIEHDDEVDQLYVQVFRRILSSMIQDPVSIQADIHLQSVAKGLERMADHGTNVAEQVIFMVEGTDVRHPGKLPTSNGRSERS